MSMRLKRICLLLFCIGCQPETNPEPVADRTAIARFAQMPADTSCGFVAHEHHPDAAQLVEDFLQRDGEGAQLGGGDPFMASARWCPNHIPGWDVASLVSGSESSPLMADDTSAMFEVRHVMLGRLNQDSLGFFLEENIGIQTDTFHLRRTQYGWRIVAPIQHAHLFPRSALEQIRRMHDASRSRIMALMQDTLL